MTLHIKGDGSSMGIKGDLEITTKEGALSLLESIQTSIDEGDFDDN